MAANQLVWGLAIASIAGAELLAERFPNSRWRGLAGWSSWLGCLCVAVFLILPEGSPSGVQSLSDEERARWYKIVRLKLLGALCIGLVFALRQYVWAAIALGTGASIWFANVARVLDRTYIFAVTGWLVGGYVVLFFPWPNEQRLILVFVIGGLATAMQGGWGLVKTVSRGGRRNSTAGGR